MIGHSAAKSGFIPGGDAGRSPIIVISCIGGNCPVQAEGTIDGAPFYFRARGDEWSIEIGGGFVLEDASKGIPATGFYMEREYGDGPYDAGWMPVEEARSFINEAATEYAKGQAAHASPIQHGYEAEGVVSPNIKAKAQGEGG